MITTTNVHYGPEDKAQATLHYREGDNVDAAFVTLNLGENAVSVFLRDRRALETIRAAVAQADDLLAQIDAAKAVQAKVESDRGEFLSLMTDDGEG